MDHYYEQILYHHCKNPCQVGYVGLSIKLVDLMDYHFQIPSYTNLNSVLYYLSCFGVD